MLENTTHSLTQNHRHLLRATEHRLRSDTGGERAAAIYTFVQPAKLNAVNPEAYLRDILAKIADGHHINKIDALLPWQGKSSG